MTAASLGSRALIADFETWLLINTPISSLLGYFVWALVFLAFVNTYFKRVWVFFVALNAFIGPLAYVGRIVQLYRDVGLLAPSNLLWMCLALAFLSSLSVPLFFSFFARHRFSFPKGEKPSVSTTPLERQKREAYQEQFSEAGERSNIDNKVVQPREMGSSGNPLGSRDRGEIILKYSEEARACFQRLAGYPPEWKDEFLKELAKRPADDPEEVISTVVLRLLGRPDLKWSSDIWAGLEATRASGNYEFLEFIRVFPVLSDIMTVSEISRKVIEGKRARVSKRYWIASGDGGKRVLHRLDDGTLALELDESSFASLEDVYDFLKVSPKYRYPLYLLNEIYDDVTES